MSLRVKILTPLFIVAFAGCISIGFLTLVILQIANKNNLSMETALIADAESIKVYHNLSALIWLTERVTSMTQIISEQEIKSDFDTISNALSSNITKLKLQAQTNEIFGISDNLSLEIMAMQEDTAVLLGVKKSNEIPTLELFNRHVVKVGDLADVLVAKTRENALFFMDKSATDMRNVLALTALAMVSFIAVATFLAFRSVNKFSKMIIHTVEEIIELAETPRTNIPQKFDEMEEMKSSLAILRESLDEKKKITEALSASREQFKTLFAHAPVGMAIIDETASFTRVNAALCDFLGCSESDIISKKYWDFMLPTESRELSITIEALRSGKEADHQEEHQFVTKEGQIIWGLASVSHDKHPVTGHDRYIAQIQDITKIKELEKIKSEFIATVSHELRTPLTSIKGAIALILGTKKDQLSDTTVRLLNIANSNCERLTSLVNDILDMEKISSKNLAIHFAEEDLKEQIQNSVENMLPYAIENKVSIKCELPAAVPIIWADKNRMEQVLANLLSNAAKFSIPETEIQVGLIVDDKFAKVTIRNSGIGISKEQSFKLFKPFSQIDSSSSREKEGTGLGLYITKQIVEQMGGEIDFNSVEGSHTVFWFTVPLKTSVVR